MTTKAIVLPPDYGQNAPQHLDNGNPTVSAVARAFASSMAFMFKRPPLRFFRPVKISTYAALQTLANERNKPLTPRLVRSLVRSQGGPSSFFIHSVLPPFAFNTIAGLTLFAAYTSAESHLRSLPECSAQDGWRIGVVPGLAGACAGAAQAVVSAPLDNCRLLLDEQARKGQKFTGWYRLMKNSLLPPFLAPTPGASGKNPPATTSAATLKLWVSRGWSLTTLSVLKDSIGFATFFTLFSLGRSLAKRLAVYTDSGLMRIYPAWDRREARSWTGRIVQGAAIVLSGATAGWAYGVVAAPFEAVRVTVWETRLRWAEGRAAAAVLQEKASRVDGRNPSATEASPAHKRKRPSVAAHSTTHAEKAETIKARRTRFAARLPPADPLRSPHLPSAVSILRYRIRSFGWRHFLATASAHRGGTASTSRAGAVGGVKDGLGGKLLHGQRRFASMAGFKSFLLTPYAIGFFVYAVSSGDLAEGGI